MKPCSNCGSSVITSSNSKHDSRWCLDECMKCGVGQ